MTLTIHPGWLSLRHVVLLTHLLRLSGSPYSKKLFYKEYYLVTHAA